MSLTMKGKNQPSTSGEQKPLPKKGARTARLVKVIDLGVHDREPFKGKAKDPCQQVVLEFDLVDDLHTFDEEKGPQPIRINTGYNYPLNVVYGQDGTPHEKSTLREFIRALDPTNEHDYDLTKMLLAPCILNIVHNHNEERGLTYANIDSAGPVPEIEGFTVTATDAEPFVFDFDTFTPDDYEILPEFIQDIVKAANNFKWPDFGGPEKKDDVPY